MRRSQKIRAFTLIELLIVIAIMGMLIQLLLPAVQAARESARRTQCSNNLRQISLGVQSHHNTHIRFPSGGWTVQWVGEPELGTGVDQPGSWIFNTLEYLEQGNIRNMGLNLEGQERTDAIRQRCATPISLFNCPSRRAADVYPQTQTRQPFTLGGKLLLEIVRGAKSDYAANIGSKYAGVAFKFFNWKSPETYEDWFSEEMVWPTDSAFLTSEEEPVVYDGLIHGRSEVSYKHITDGTSQTYLLGEKSLHHQHYELGSPNKGDEENMYVGFGSDTCRSAQPSPIPDDKTNYRSFGSAHSGGFQMAFADGSVRRISYSIDVEIHNALGSRNGEELVNSGEY